MRAILVRFLANKRGSGNEIVLGLNLIHGAAYDLEVNLRYVKF